MTRKPIILVDQDGPLCAFDDKFYGVCRDQGYTMHGGEIDYDTRCTIHRFAVDCIDDPEHRKLSRQFVNNTGWFRSLEPTPGAVDGMAKLSEVADVWICTKPLEANLSCRDEKAEWVRTHLGSEWERKLIITPNKGMVAGDVLLDDAIKLAWMPYAQWTPVVFPMTWNGEGSDWEPFERWGWDDPIEDLLELAYG